MCDYLALRPVSRETLPRQSSCLFTTSPGPASSTDNNNNGKVLSKSHSCSSNNGGHPERLSSGFFKGGNRGDLSRSRSREQDSDTDPLLGVTGESDFDSDATGPDSEDELPKDQNSNCTPGASKGIDGVADAPARRQCSQRSCKRMSPAAPPTAQLSERDSALLQKKYEEKVNHTKYELVAGFVVERGIIQAYTIYRLRVPFEVTERRRRIIQRYYSQGCQEVMLYVNKMEFEHYMPVSYRPLPNTSKTRQKKSKFKFFNLRR